ncbi:MAG TPA: Rne/Rng family ribonuclease [Myxococcota bacterium]|nr:Rne/Rng family ribonuclease [Myxococcota bacterium]
MSSEIIVNKTGREVRVALLENGQLTEFHIDRGRSRGYVGNVYKGRVVRVLPGMQAAFVDVGLERAAFLYVGDIYKESLDLPNREPKSADQTVVEETPRAHPRSGQPAIQDLLKEGQEIVVQVAKDPIGTKGARLTTHVTLPGRYIVYMPTVEHVGISRRIEKDKERRRLRDFVNKHRPKGAGFIVRTVCANQPNHVLKQDMDYLLRTWEKVQKAATEKKAPAPLHIDYGLAVRFLRDNLRDDVQRIVVDSRDIYDELAGFMSNFMPDFNERVHVYRGKEPVFDVYGVETEVNRSLGRKVWLKSGGYLVIDQTEALTAIDINSGKYVGKSSLEETTTKINMEAIKEIVHQLRLRNIGGIVVIDFIDMEKEANRDKVFNALEEEARRDKARTNVLKISELGLVEMTRKRVQEDLIRFLTEDCFYCEGNGHLRARETLCFDIFREALREAARSGQRETIFVNTHPLVADMLYGEEFESLDAFERRIEKRIVVRAMGHFHLERYEVYSR